MKPRLATQTTQRLALDSLTGGKLERGGCRRLMEPNRNEPHCSISVSQKFFFGKILPLREFGVCILLCGHDVQGMYFGKLDPWRLTYLNIIVQTGIKLYFGTIMHTYWRVVADTFPARLHALEETALFRPPS
jgi:hypothetical protein